MDLQQWARIEELFVKAADLTENDRAAFLSEACSGNESLRREVETLLACDKPVDAFLQASIADAARELPVAEEDSTALVGTKLGSYTVTALIGKGGMGAVYRGVRDDDFRMDVAIKVLKRGMDTEAALERFRSERKILARLQHANIAHLIDGGACPDGTPYFVMEFVDGVPITDYCRAHKLAIPAILDLFRLICDAVHHAHKNLVVHRDLKPRNILVTADGPKLLDFGIAKILDDNQDTAVTMLPMRAMTPEYASPEQVLGEPITTASDVYSLGLLLYELLTGRQAQSFADRTPQEIVKVVSEQEPPLPSAVGGREFRGDIDNIILTAMRKEPARRYASVQEFSEDIARYRTGRPVIARKDTGWYIAGKFLKRHKAWAAAAAVALLSLVVATAVSSWQAHIASVERTKAEQRFNDVRRLARSLLYELHGEIQQLPGSTRARSLLLTRSLEYLDNLARGAEGNVPLQMELAEAYERVGELQSANLGQTKEALSGQGQAVAILERVVVHSPDDAAARLRLAGAYAKFGWLLAATGDETRGRQYYTKELNLSQQAVNANPSDTDARRQMARGYVDLASSFFRAGDLDAASEHQRRALDVFEQLAAREPQNRAYEANRALGYRLLGGIQAAQNRFPESLASAQAALRLDEDRAAANPQNQDIRLDVSADLRDIAYCLWQTGRLAEAAANYRKALEITEAVAAADPHDVSRRQWIALTSLRLGQVLVEMDQTSEGLEKLMRAVTLDEQFVRDDAGSVHKQVLLAAAYRAVGDAHRKKARASRQSASWREARIWYRRSVESFEAAQSRGAVNAREQSANDDAKKAIQECESTLARSQ